VSTGDDASERDAFPVRARASNGSGLLACCGPGTCRVPRISSLTVLYIPLSSFGEFYNIKTSEYICRYGGFINGEDRAVTRVDVVAGRRR